MKHQLKYFLCILLTGLVIITACKKETSCEGCKENNKPPIAIAGPDQVITLPTDSISLDGSASNDPDGTISEWLWKKISGPASFNIISLSTAKTIVKNLVVGTYQFELKVTDDKGLTAKDTIQVNINTGTPINRPPVANAGPDQTISLPTNTVNVDGSASTDPDNNITGYAWTKISGPSSFNIVNANAVQTQVTNLVEGVYKFELKVTDAGGLFSRDTVQIAVINQQNCCGQRPIIQASLTQIGNLSVPRMPIAATAANKVLFAGGWSGFTCNTGSGWHPTSTSSVVDIYDIQTNSWTIGQLSVPRAGIRSVSLGNKIFFAGGENGISTVYDNVDIYDVSNNTWTTVHLSTPRAYVATAAIGNKVFFAGGYYYTAASQIAVPHGISNIVDIYDVATNQWSTATLSGPITRLLTATSLNGKVYFADGNNGIINIYDNNTNSWSTSNFQISWSFSIWTTLVSFAVGDNIYWAGTVNECLDREGDPIANGKVEIRNTISNTTAINCFPLIGSQHPVIRNNEVAFFNSRIIQNPWGGWGAISSFRIYNISTGDWSIGQAANFSYTENHDAGVVSANNTIYVGGGSYPSSCITLFDKVYILSW